MPLSLVSSVFTCIYLCHCLWSVLSLLVYIYATVFGQFCLYLYISMPLSMVSSVFTCIYLCHCLWSVLSACIYLCHCLWSVLCLSALLSLISSLYTLLSLISSLYTFLSLISSLYTLLSLASSLYWVVQAGLLTPLTFAWHCLSPLATFTSGVYFLHNERW